MSRQNEYACEECDGVGEIECPCCGASSECAECEGSGLDGQRLDVPALLAAEMELLKKGGTWAWTDPVTHRIIGRRNDTATLAYADFAKK